MSLQDYRGFIAALYAVSRFPDALPRLMGAA